MKRKIAVLSTVLVVIKIMLIAALCLSVFLPPAIAEIKTYHGKEIYTQRKYRDEADSG